MSGITEGEWEIVDRPQGGFDVRTKPDATGKSLLIAAAMNYEDAQLLVAAKLSVEERMNAIKSANLLTDVFGHWPNFHDAEICSVRLDRNRADGTVPSVTMLIHVFELSGTTDQHGFYHAKASVMVELGFSDVQSLELSGLNSQNVLNGLMIEPDPTDARFTVELDSSYGLSGAFTCGQINVLSARPHRYHPSPPV